jgi:O-antigen/teichoic acid export membrane protein
MSHTTVQNAWSERIIVRFGTTFIANIFRAALSFLGGMLIARGLGASSYGDLNFLLGSFAAISQLLDAGTSSAFYTFISQRRRSRAFVALYAAWMVCQFGLTTLIVALLPMSLVHGIWVGHDRRVVLLAFGASFLMNQLWGVVSQLAEAMRRTVLIQLVGVIQAFAHVALVLLMIRRGWLTVPVAMVLLVGEYLVLALVLGPKLTRLNLEQQANPDDNYKAAFREFTNYCAPLVIYGAVGFVYTFADRWLLQQYGGSEQQGFFAVGQQVANVSLIATSSVLRVFWKEVAEAIHRQDHARVEKLYMSVSRSLYFVGAGISSLFIPFSREILVRTAGSGYERGWVCLSLMLLFPIHQSLGQIQGTFFYASSNTRSYTKIGLLIMGVSIPVTYFVLAPRSSTVAGLGLGAVGLAIKLVVLQILAVNLQAYVLARANHWAYDFNFQIVVCLTLISLGWICRWVSVAVVGLTGSFQSPIVVMATAGLLYTALVSIVLYLKPDLAGLTRGQVRGMVDGTSRWLRSTTSVREV